MNEQKEQVGIELIANVLTAGLTAEEAQRVLIAHAKFENCDSSFPGAFSVMLCNAARVTIGVYRQTTLLLRDAPARIQKAVDSINLATIGNQKFVDTTAQDLKRAAWEIREQQTAIKKEMNGWKREKLIWLRIMGGCCILTVLLAGVAVYEVHTNRRISQQAVADFTKAAVPLTAKATAVSELQRVIISRGNLNAEIVKWKEDADAYKADKQLNQNPNELTVEQEAVRAELEERQAALLERRDALLDKERREGWAIK